MPSGANMTQKTLNARWCRYDTKDIKYHVVPVNDVVSVVMASAILTSLDLWRLMCRMVITWLGAILAPPAFGVVCTLMVPPGLKRVQCKAKCHCRYIHRGSQYPCAHFLWVRFVILPFSSSQRETALFPQNFLRFSLIFLKFSLNFFTIF